MPARALSASRLFLRQTIGLGTPSGGMAHLVIAIVVLTPLPLLGSEAGLSVWFAAVFASWGLVGADLYLMTRPKPPSGGREADAPHVPASVRERARNLAVLGLTEPATDGDIRKAWKKAVFASHPDRNRGSAAGVTRFHAVQAAFAALTRR